jgi:hypothetical protein
LSASGHNKGRERLDEGQQKGIPFLWLGPEDVPILFVNQFVSQFYHDAFIVTIGQTAPPPVVGTPEEIAEQLEDVSYVPVKPAVRLGLSESAMRELIAHLQANLDQYEQAQQAKGGEEGWPT